jgi:hypothetical protein
MRKALIPALLLVVVAMVLGSTVFREQIVHAATTTRATSFSISRAGAAEGTPTRST